MLAQVRLEPTADLVHRGIRAETGSPGDLAVRSHFGSPAGPVLVLDTSDLVGTLALGTWMLEGRILALRCLMRG